LPEQEQQALRRSLQRWQMHASEVVRESVSWALAGQPSAVSNA